MRWAALLRGVNVGGRKLPMADLRAMLEAMGFADVTTLLASGNAVFTSEETDAAGLEHRLEEASEQKLAFRTDFLVRDRSELAAVIAANPFVDSAVDRPNRLVVLFHREPFDPALLEALAARYDGPERLHAIGRELYIDFREGQGESKLLPMMAKLKFPKIATGRNWNTVGKLLARLGD